MSLAARRSAAVRAQRAARTLVVYADRLLFDVVRAEWERMCGDAIRYGRLPRVPVALLSADPASVARLVAAGLLGEGGCVEWDAASPRAVWPCAGAIEWFATFGPAEDGFYQTRPCGEPDCPGHPAHGVRCPMCGDLGRPRVRAYDAVRA